MPTSEGKMREAKVALLVGCSKTANPTLELLPAGDNIDALRHVLNHPEIGKFQVVDKLLDQPSGHVSRKIEQFFKRADCKPDELLLLYFSCHGILDTTGQLYFAMSDTDKHFPDSTGISARDVNRWMNQSRSERIVLLLDCCYGGAFKNGLTRGDTNAERILKQQLGGKGRVVITASDELELAHGSEFTDAVVRGLETGDADRDDDGRVSVYELYQYVHDEVRQNRPDQTPTMPVSNMSGALYLADNPYPSLPLPDDLDQALKNNTVWLRRGAVDGLRRLLAENHPPGRKRTARRALSSLCHDPDPDIQEAAKEALGRRPRLTAVTVSRRSPVRHRLGWASVILAVLGSIIFVPTIIHYIPCTPETKIARGGLSLGTLFPKTEDVVYYGQALNAGVQLAIKDINEAPRHPWRNPEHLQR